MHGVQNHKPDQPMASPGSKFDSAPGGGMKVQVRARGGGDSLPACASSLWPQSCTTLLLLHSHLQMTVVPEEELELAQQVVRSIYVRWQHQVQRWADYRSLLLFLAFTALYLGVLYTQRDAHLAYQVGEGRRVRGRCMATARRRLHVGAQRLD